MEEWAPFRCRLAAAALAGCGTDGGDAHPPQPSVALALPCSDSQQPSPFARPPSSPPTCSSPGVASSAGSTSRSSGRCLATAGEKAQKGSAPAGACVWGQGRRATAHWPAGRNPGLRRCASGDSGSIGACHRPLASPAHRSPEKPSSLVTVRMSPPPLARARSAARAIAPNTTLSVAPCAGPAASPPAASLLLLLLLLAGCLSDSSAAADGCTAWHEGGKEAGRAKVGQRRRAAAAAAAQQ